MTETAILQFVECLQENCVFFGTFRTCRLCPLLEFKICNSTASQLFKANHLLYDNFSMQVGKENKQ